MFRDAKVGDKCWTIQLGDAEIVGIFPGCPYPVKLGNGKRECAYTLGGLENMADLFPSAFWSNPNIIPPPRPKRKVKKVFESWGNVYRHSISFHESKEACLYSRGLCFLGEPIFFRHEYEVEE